MRKVNQKHVKITVFYQVEPGVIECREKAS